MMKIVEQQISRSLLPAVGDLFERVFERPFNAEFYAWRFLDNPFGPTMVELAVDGTRVASHYALCPAVMRTAGGRRVQCAQSMTTMTDPDYGGQGLFPQLAAGLYARIAREHGVRLVFGFPNANSHYGFVHKLGWSDVCPLFFLSRTVSGPGDDSRFELPEWDEVTRYLEMHDSTAVGHQPYARTPEFVQWRYRWNPEQRYVLVAPEGAAVNGTAVVTKHFEGESGEPSLDIVDFLGEMNLDGVGAAIAAAVGYARSKSIAEVQGWVNLHHPAYRAFERLRFRPTGPITYFGISPLTEGTEVDGDPRSWWITMGDSDVF